MFPEEFACAWPYPHTSSSTWNEPDTCDAPANEGSFGKMDEWTDLTEICEETWDILDLPNPPTNMALEPLDTYSEECDTRPSLHPRLRARQTTTSGGLLQAYEFDQPSTQVILDFVAGSPVSNGSCLDEIQALTYAETPPRMPVHTLTPPAQHSEPCYPLVSRTHACACGSVNEPYLRSISEALTPPSPQHAHVSCACFAAKGSCMVALAAWHTAEAHRKLKSTAEVPLGVKQDLD